MTLIIVLFAVFILFAPRIWMWWLEEPLKRFVKDATSQALNDVLRLESGRAVDENFRNSDKAEEFLGDNLVGGYLKLIVRLGVRQELSFREASKKLLEDER